jgi:hypothetical protein
MIAIDVIHSVVYSGKLVQLGFERFFRNIVTANPFAIIRILFSHIIAVFLDPSYSLPASLSKEKAWEMAAKPCNSFILQDTGSRWLLGEE